jgi:hypothetical protein
MLVGKGEKRGRGGERWEIIRGLGKGALEAGGVEKLVRLAMVAQFL